ncbi:MAG TPA: thioredoxin domain-containing protein [Terriglobales bacterium]|nr:thioredoxin domain-containing protein [Terriglobales bacterium]
MSTATQNSLSHAASSYLRSAAHQPIRWHEWGEEAFRLAQAENKPILLDIGAVWCHWCHVMDRESYENPAIAELVNQHFVAVKVDRDERPDVDSRYQAAVQAVSGQGGWPLTVFLTPDGKPFYGGTYFPPDDMHGRPGFKRVLLSISEAFKTKHDEVKQSAEQLLSVISQTEAFAGRSKDFSPQVVDAIVASAEKLFDHENGGFGSAPKFPHAPAIDVLCHRYARGEKTLGNIVIGTLVRMAQGGVYDQVAGGFHRYSVDAHWIVPHFEKMAYDNSELLKNYVHGYQATGEAFFAAVAKDIIRWMDAWLSDRERGGFYASQDADISLDDDGDHFTWTLAEAQEVLRGEELAAAALRYNINEIGEMHHDPARNVLFVHAALDEIAQKLDKTPEQVSELLDRAKQKMYDARVKRPIPYIDKTVYTNWNALCISAYLAAARILRLEDARHFALRSLDRILAEAWSPERGLGHVLAYSDPQAAPRHVPGMLDDYAYTAIACLDAYEATADLSYFNFAKKIVDRMVDRFFDPVGSGFFDTASGEQGALGALSARRKPFQDSPTPAGNPSAAIALLRMHAYTNDNAYREKAEDTLEVFAGVADQFGIYAGTYGIAAVLFSAPHTQVVVIGEDERAQQLEAAALAPFALNKAVLRIAHNDVVPQNLPPALAESIANLPAVTQAASVAVVCSGFSCKPPLADPDDLERAVRASLQA